MTNRFPTGNPIGLPNDAHVIGTDSTPSTTTVRVVHVLSKEQLGTLKKKLPRAVPREGSTPQDYGYLLGIQYVLDVLEEGFTKS